MSQRSIDLHELPDRVRLFGEYDRNLSAIESSLDVAVRADGDQLVVAGDAAAVARAEGVVRRVLDAAIAGAHITPHDVALALSEAQHATEMPAPAETLLHTHRGREIRAAYQRSARVRSRDRRSDTLTFGIGPAGTGKTYLAVVMAVRALKHREVARDRPVASGRSKPANDWDSCPATCARKSIRTCGRFSTRCTTCSTTRSCRKYMERGTLEVAPLAFMRGRTLSDAFVILDEAQNATDDQIKMFLTRLGSGSKMVVTGDVTQIDLPAGQRSGLRAAATRLNGDRRDPRGRTRRYRRRAPSAGRAYRARVREVIRGGALS